jgi:hypothetical protein
VRTVSSLEAAKVSEGCSFELWGLVALCSCQAALYVRCWRVLPIACCCQRQAKLEMDHGLSMRHIAELKADNVCLSAAPSVIVHEVVCSFAWVHFGVTSPWCFRCC